MEKDEWIKDRVVYFKGLKSRTEQQEIFVFLAEKKNRTAQDDKKFNAIIRAEMASDKASTARQKASKLIKDEKMAIEKAERAARINELCKSSELLILAGFVDAKTGQPLIDKGKLLGALLGLSKIPANNRKWVKWKLVGDALLPKYSATTEEKKVEDNTDVNPGLPGNPSTEKNPVMQGDSQP